MGLTASFALIGSGAASVPTQVGTPGEACVFNAPDGAPILAGLIRFGHVGWGFRNGTGDNWIYGATEDSSGTSHIDPGPNAKALSSSWHNTGTYSQMLNAFGIGSLTDSQTGAHYNDGPGYYRRYRCSQIDTSYPSAAMAAVTDVETGSDSGYDFLTNNCLTKAVIILGSYGFMNLPGAAAVPPNGYFLNDLPNPTPSAPGFSGPQYFTTLTIGVKLVDPLNGQYLNTSPMDQQRPIRILVYDGLSQNPVYDSGYSAMANLTPSTDRYQATLQLPTDVTAHEPVWSTGGIAGAYRIQVALEYTLLNYVPGTVYISQGQNTTVSDTSLTAGDVNGDNQVDIADYDILERCYSDLSPPKGPCSPQEKAGSDLNDDGNVNGIDYNEMLRVFESQGGP